MAAIQRILLQDGCFVDLPASIVPDMEGMAMRILDAAETKPLYHTDHMAVLLQGHVLLDEGAFSTVSCGGLLARVPRLSSGAPPNPVRILLQRRAHLA